MKRTFLAFAMLILISLFGCSNNLKDTQNTPLVIFDGGDGEESPIQPAPKYSTKCRLLGIEGTVILEATITETGETKDVKVIGTKGYRAEELSQAAIDAVKQWKMEPTIENGKAVAKVVQIPIEFNLTEKNHALRTNIKSEPQEADIYVDGEFIAKTNAELYLTKKTTYKLLITKPGYESIERDILIAQNDSTGLFFSLQKVGN